MNSAPKTSLNQWNALKADDNCMLIVDDDAINREQLDHIFSSFYATEHAANAREALTALLAAPQKYCALLLDVVMPEMSGMDVLHAMASRGLTQKIPVFLITGDASDTVINAAYELGVMDVISKPIMSRVVQRRINSVVELFRAREALSSKVQRQQAELYRQAQKIIHLNRGLIAALATAIEFRSGESGAHVQRIHHITRHLLLHTPLGQGLDAETIEQIALAAIMHDVGKIAIADSILNKPGALTAEEFEIMKRHTILGAELLQKIPQLHEHPAFAYAYDIARHHHERWDGRGYPDGLKGDEISLWAQIVSLADVYDALLSERCYKKPFSREKTLRMIKEKQCGIFNPRLLECFFAAEHDLYVFYA